MMNLFHVAVVFSCVTTNSAVNGKREDNGNDNSPRSYNNGPNDELTYPYFNVHYHFNKYDWNRILDDQQKLIALRRRVAQIRRQINDDKKQADNFMQYQDGLLKDARSTLFERALYGTTHKEGAHRFKKHPADIHDRIHLANASFYSPIPSADFLDTNQPYYYHLLSEQIA